MTLTKDEILNAFRSRHATKEFDASKKISDSDFEFILETGRLSPSSFGFEPWKFVVIQNMELRMKLAEYASGARKQLPTASHFVVVLSRLSKDLEAGSDYIHGMLHQVQKLPPEVAATKQGTYDRFLKTGFQLAENARAMFEWGCRQTYIALGNMMTAAALIGIDSCPMEGFEKENIERLLAEEGILDTAHFGVACMAAFGYRLNEPAEKTRRAADEVISWVK